MEQDCDQAVTKRKRMKVGDVQEIGGIRVVCVPDYLLTRVGMDPNTTGILLPPAAADALLVEMRKAGLVEADAEDAAEPQ